MQKEKVVSSESLIELIYSIPVQKLKILIIEEIEESGITSDQYNFFTAIADRWLTKLKNRDSDEDD